MLVQRYGEVPPRISIREQLNLTNRDSKCKKIIFLKFDWGCPVVETLLCSH